MKLTDRALLVQLSISQWTARKYDKKASKEVAKTHGAADAAGRYNKMLLPMNDSLANVHRMATTIRKKFYTNTLPWGIEGTQILPTKNYLSFVTEYRNDKNDWEVLVNRFLDEYENLKAEAEKYLGSLYDEADYPSTEAIRDRFRMDLAVFPVPSNDFRVDISNAELSRIQQDVEERVQSAAQNAMNDAWKRLYEKVEHIAERLADPKNIFHDTMIENARDLCGLLTRLNFADDPDLEAMRQDVERKLVGHHPEALRTDLDLRRETADEAKAIMDKMRSFMGS